MSIDAGEKLCAIKAAEILNEINKNQIGYDCTKSFAEQLHDYYVKKSFPERDSFVLGGTPSVLE